MTTFGITAERERRTAEPTFGGTVEVRPAAMPTPAVDI